MQSAISVTTLSAVHLTDKPAPAPFACAIGAFARQMNAGPQPGAPQDSLNLQPKLRHNSYITDITQRARKEIRQ